MLLKLLNNDCSEEVLALAPLIVVMESSRHDSSSWKLHGGAREMSQLAKCLPHKCKDLSLSFRTYVKKKTSQCGRNRLIIPELKKWRRVDQWGSCSYTTTPMCNHTYVNTYIQILHGASILWHIQRVHVHSLMARSV